MFSLGLTGYDRKTRCCYQSAERVAVIGPITHMRCSTFESVKDTMQVHVHDPVPFSFVHFVEVTTPCTDAGISKTAIDTAMDLQGFCEAGFDLVLVSNVALPHRNPGSIGLQGVQCIIIFFFVRTPDRNFAALGGEAFGHT